MEKQDPRQILQVIPLDEDVNILFGVSDNSSRLAPNLSFRATVSLRLWEVTV